MNSELVRDTVKQVLEIEAPDELFLLEEYTASTEIAAPTASGLMGMGIDLVTGLLLPFIWKFVQSFFEDLYAEFQKEAAKQSVQHIKSLIKRKADEQLHENTIFWNESDVTQLSALVTLELERSGVELKKHPAVPLTFARVLLEKTWQIEKNS